MDELYFEKRRLDYLNRTSGVASVIDTVKRNYGIYIRWLKHTKQKKSMCTYRSILSSVVYYRNLLRSLGLPFGASNYA